MLFLYDTGLIEPDLEFRQPVLSLTDADLSGADLGGANLSGVKGITNEELEAHVSSLESATMPNGQTYEEWLKSKGRGEDGENGGSS